MSEYFTITNSENLKKIDIDFEVQEDSWNQVLQNLTELSLQIAKKIFTQLGLNDYVNHIEFSIILSNDEYIKNINALYRSKPHTTNVLSFPIQDIKDNKFDELQIHDGFTALGDIIFAYETVKNESLRDAKTFQDHFAHLLVHGILHLLGYDHEHDDEAIKMENTETEILANFNIKSPYKNLT